MAERIKKRIGTPADSEFLYDLLKQSLRSYVEATYGPWDESWQRKHFSETTDPVAHQIIECDGRPVGCLLIEESAESIALHRLVILPEYQNRRIGTRLVRELLSRAAGAGKRVRLRVLSVNPAVRFYEHLGFRQAGRTNTHIIMENTA